MNALIRNKVVNKDKTTMASVIMALIIFYHFMPFYVWSLAGSNIISFIYGHENEAYNSMKNV